MSVTQDYKTVTLSRAEAFAVIRGLRARIDELNAHLAAKPGPGQGAAYLTAQLIEAKAVLATIKALPFRSVSVQAAA